MAGIITYKRVLNLIKLVLWNKVYTFNFYVLIICLRTFWSFLIWVCIYNIRVCVGGALHLCLWKTLSNTSGLAIIPFIDYALGVSCKKCLLYPKSSRFFSMLYSRSFIVLEFTCWFIIHFEIVFAKCVKLAYIYICI